MILINSGLLWSKTGGGDKNGSLRFTLILFFVPLSEFSVLKFIMQLVI